MRVWRITPARYLGDLTRGIGGLHAAGRWHERGVPVLYAADHPSTALLELIVNVGAAKLKQGDYVLVPLRLPADATRVVEVEDLPPDWRQHPHPDATRALGMGWIRARRHLALVVPSAVFPQARNVVLNPVHPRIGEVEVDAAVPLEIDERLTR